MVNYKGYHHYYVFEPSKLKMIGAEIEQRYADIEEQDVKKLAAYRLPRILERVRKTPMERLNALAESLRRTDITILLYQYPYVNESEETQHKINQVLGWRSTLSMHRFAWDLLQQLVNDRMLQELFRFMHEATGDCYAFLDASCRTVESNRVLAAAVNDRDGLAAGLVPILLSGSLLASETLSQLKITEDSPLEAYLVYELLKRSLGQDAIVAQEGEEYLVQKLERYETDSYKQLMKIYLEARPFTGFHSKMMEQLIVRLHDPSSGKSDWSFLRAETLENVKRWIRFRNLKTAFDLDGDRNKRFDFWSGYLHRIEEVELIHGPNEPTMAFIYFKRFVVVEFGRIGSAYFYHQEGFQRWVRPRRQLSNYRHGSLQTKENLMKDKDRLKFGVHPLFINSLPHLGSPTTWQTKFNRYVQAYMMGDHTFTEEEENRP